jgi:hypothetical protein
MTNNVMIYYVLREKIKHAYDNYLGSGSVV